MDSGSCFEELSTARDTGQSSNDHLRSRPRPRSGWAPGLREACGEGGTGAWARVPRQL